MKTNKCHICDQKFDQISLTVHLSTFHQNVNKQHKCEVILFLGIEKHVRQMALQHFWRIAFLIFFSPTAAPVGNYFYTNSQDYAIMSCI